MKRGRADHYLDVYGGWDATDEELDAIFARWLPDCRLRHLRGEPGLPLYFAGNVYGLSSTAEMPTVRLAVRSGWRSAGAVSLIVDEYLRRGLTPPEVLAACSTLCWAEDLVRRPEEKTR